MWGRHVADERWSQEYGGGVDLGWVARGSIEKGNPSERELKRSAPGTLTAAGPCPVVLIAVSEGSAQSREDFMTAAERVIFP